MGSKSSVREKVGARCFSLDLFVMSDNMTSAPRRSL